MMIREEQGKETQSVGDGGRESLAADERDGGYGHGEVHLGHSRRRAAMMVGVCHGGRAGRGLETEEPEEHPYFAVLTEWLSGG